MAALGPKVVTGRPDWPEPLQSILDRDLLSDRRHLGLLSEEVAHQRAARSLGGFTSHRDTLVPAGARVRNGC